MAELDDRPEGPPLWRTRLRGGRVATVSLALLTTLVLLQIVVAGSPAPLSLATRHRQPVALVVARDGGTLFVANSRSGSLSVIDLGAARVATECEVGRSLSGIALLPDDIHLLATDRTAGELILLERKASDVRVVSRLDVGPDPVGVHISADGSACMVASLWPRRVTAIDLVRENEKMVVPRIRRTVELPFSPRNMLEIREGTKWIVADAFGGRLAVLDVKRDALDLVRTLPAHNIRGLVVSPDGRKLGIAHQVLHRLARTSFEDVHWGSLIGNHLRFVSLDAVLGKGSDADLLRTSRTLNLGEVGDAAGDPSAAVSDGMGNHVIALAGVGEVTIARGPGESQWRVSVGRQPTAVAVSRDKGTVYVADTADDTVSVVDIASSARRATISLGPRPSQSAVERGEQLFHDAKLSHDGWMSCHSCHTDGHTNGLVNDTLGDGSFGAPKRVPSLLGVGSTGPWTWTGSMERLEGQVRKSIETTMQGPKPTEAQVEDLTAYLRTLVPPTPAQTSASRIDDPAVIRGAAVFRSRECATCHAEPDYTVTGRFDVGLVDEVGNRKFNPPSLRGVSRREPLLHDGRAAGLVEVFRNHGHPRGLELTSQEIGDLVAFLKSL